MNSTAAIKGRLNRAIHSEDRPSAAPVAAYVPMPDGSSSEAPVISPGPRIRKRRLIGFFSCPIAAPLTCSAGRRSDSGGAIGDLLMLITLDEHESRILLSPVKAGGFFGEVSLFDGGERTANAIATETTQVVILRQDVMVAFLYKNPKAAIHVINVLSRRLRDNTLLLATNKDRKAFDVLEEDRKSVV